MVRRLAVVVAHPDDDTFGCSGTVALHADDPAFRFVLIHATNGAAGQIAEGSGATRETLGIVREEEDRRSWVALGREPDRHEWLGYPDGGVADEPFERLVDRIAAILDEERPDVVITFGPDGVTGHRGPHHGRPGGHGRVRPARRRRRRVRQAPAPGDPPLRDRRVERAARRRRQGAVRPDGAVPAARRARTTRSGSRSTARAWSIASSRRCSSTGRRPATSTRSTTTGCARLSRARRT